MTDYLFRWRRPPRMREYVLPAITTMLALGLSFAAGWAFVDPAQRRDPINLYGVSIIALLSWLLPWFFWSMLVLKRGQFRDRVPVLTVNGRGISTKDWLGKPLTFSWAEFTFQRVQRGSSDDILFRTETYSGSIALNDLDGDPGAITDLMSRFSRYAT